MKKLLLVAVICCLTAIAKAQIFNKEVYREITLPAEKIDANDLTTHAFTDPETGWVYLQLCDKQYLQRLVLDSQLNQLHAFTRKGLQVDAADSIYDPERYIVIGSTVKEMNQYIYYQSKDGKRVISEVIDFSGQTSAVDSLLILSPNENIVSYLTEGNNFYIITSLSPGTKINIYSKKGASPFTVHEITLKHPNHNDYNNFLFNALKQIRPMKSNEENSLYNATAKTKSYVNNNRLFLTFDHVKEETSIIVIDLLNWQQRLQTIPNTFRGCPIAGETSGSNSFLVDSLLFQVNACPEQLNFTVTDIYTKKLLQQFSTPKNENIAYRNTPVKLIGAMSLRTKNVNEFTDTKPFLKKITNLNLAINVLQRKQQNDFLVTIGTAEMEERQKGGGWTPYFMGGTWHYMYTGTGGNLFNLFETYTQLKSYYFESILDPSLQHREGPVPADVKSKISTFEKARIGGEFGKTLFRVNGTYYYAFYNRKVNKFQFLAF